jgi:hypothetical protein
MLLLLHCTQQVEKLPNAAFTSQHAACGKTSECFFYFTARSMWKNFRMLLLLHSTQHVEKLPNAAFTSQHAAGGKTSECFFYFTARSISLLPGGPGNRSTSNPTACIARRTLPLAEYVTSIPPGIRALYIFLKRSSSQSSG